MTIHIEELTFDVIIGLLDYERDNPQTVIINLEVSYDFNHENFIDYGDMVTLIQVNLKEKRYKLLEDALLGLKFILVTTYPEIKFLSLKIAKPTILPKCSVALSHTWTL